MTERSHPTVLVANDHEWSARSVETLLQAEGYVVVRAFTAEQALVKGLAVLPDAFVLDVQLPDRDGMALSEAIRAHPRLGPSVPIVLTTAGPAGRKERLAAYQAGAWEFFGQPLDAEALLAKLRVYLDAKAVTDQFRTGSLVDPETGLYNETGFVRRGQEMAAEAGRRLRAIGCAVLRPRPESSAQGVAKKIAQVLRRSGRSADAFGRLGPLDFGVVAIGAGEQELRQLVTRLRAAASGSVVDDDGGQVEIRSAICSSGPQGSDVDVAAMVREALEAFDRTDLPVAVATVG